jgi:tripartite-type tricarboxylate transporter receptor subunit TctC
MARPTFDHQTAIVRKRGVIMDCGTNSFRSGVLAGAAVFGLILPSKSFSQAPYYQGKTIAIVRGGGPGGSGEFQTRALLPYLKKYIPGNPDFVMEFMEGASGRKGANYIYNAKPDGLKIGSAGAMIPGPILGLPGSNYDIDKFIYLGSTETGNPYVFYTRKELGLDNLEKLRSKPGIRIGAQSVGHSVYVTARLFAYLLEFKEPNFIVGFTGPELDIAMGNRELDARTTSSLEDLVQKGSRDNFHYHANLAVPKGAPHPDVPGLPDLDKFAKTEKERKVLDLFRAFQYPRWPIHLPPGTPKELVQILRDAMAKTYKDPGFRRDFKKLMGRDPSPLSGEDLQKAVRELPRDAEVIALYKKFADAGPLPMR